MEKRREPETEISELKARLAEAEETLNAIRSGEVDALVTSGPEGDQVFTLQGAETPYRILIEEMSQGALMLIPDGTILYANSRFAALAKTPLEQVIGSTWTRFFHPDKHPHLEACLGTEVPPCLLDDLLLQAADGSCSPVHLAMRSMTTSGVAGFSVIVTDLTERRESESALRKTSELLLEKNEQLETFSYSVSHDMRAPLRSMQSFARILLDDYADKLDPEAKSYLDRIEVSALKLDRLIHDVLAYSRQSGAKPEMAVFDLDKVIEEMIATSPNMRDAKIEHVASSEKVRGSAVPLGQCISNLICNGLKFIPKGRIPRVKLWTEPAAGTVRLWVEDNGIGILLEDQRRIFETFTRLHASEDYEGTGLGLSMVKKAVERMGGRVGVESELGQGSRFWIELERA